TLSKSFGLAGIRLGFVLASVEMNGYMLRASAASNVNKLTSVAAMQPMRQIRVMQACVKALNNEKKWLISQLETIPSVKKVHPSDSNFLLIVIDNAYEVYKNMADTGIVVRFRGDQIHCDSTLRITVGTH